MAKKGPTKYDIANKEIEEQQGQWGYNMGKARRKKIEKNPAEGGSPKDDKYDQMNPLEKEGYKRGYSKKPED
ncbi:MAG: hypothetical protein KAJ66_06990 [Candidatus Omnitrophica bacterium]|nr:hypothetical protein [Candidatus Omnitrophota bacterium]